MKDDSKRLFATVQSITHRIHVYFVCMLYLLDMKTIRNQLKSIIPGSLNTPEFVQKWILVGSTPKHSMYPQGSNHILKIVMEPK